MHSQFHNSDYMGVNKSSRSNRITCQPCMFITIQNLLFNLIQKMDLLSFQSSQMVYSPRLSVKISVNK